MKTPKLKPIDLRKCCSKKNEDPHTFHYHPDIKSSRQYLAKIDGEWFIGCFSNQWYGWNFDGWGGGGGLQLDKPGTNASMWEGLFEIIP